MIFTPFLSIFFQEPRTHGSESRPSQRPRRGYPFCVPTAPPLALAAPAPHPRSVRRAAAARAFPLGRLPRRTHAAACARARSPAPAGVLASWPHVAAAAPAVGSWQRCLRSTRSGTAAIQQQLPNSTRGRAHPPAPPAAQGVSYRLQRLLLCPFRAVRSALGT